MPKGKDRYMRKKRMKGLESCLVVAENSAQGGKNEKKTRERN
jgi:hypothetical protein